VVHLSTKKGKAKPLPPVFLMIQDCGDCPFCDEDEGYAACEHHEAKGVHVPIYRRVNQIRIPPKNCPLRSKEASSDEK
jgi:hypothetical protein